MALRPGNGGLSTKMEIRSTICIKWFALERAVGMVLLVRRQGEELALGMEEFQNG